MADPASQPGLAARFLILLVRGYRLLLSPHVGGGCRFTPTCSQFAIDALMKYGALKGFILATHRVLRCNPWGGHGYDPPIWYSEHRTPRALHPDPDPEAPTS